LLTIHIHVIDGLVRDVDLKVGQATGRTAKEAFGLAPLGLPEGNKVVLLACLPAATATEEDDETGNGEGCNSTDLQRELANHLIKMDKFTHNTTNDGSNRSLARRRVSSIVAAVVGSVTVRRAVSVSRSRSCRGTCSAWLGHVTTLPSASPV
jgi:hypothetical protein